MRRVVRLIAVAIAACVVLSGHPAQADDAASPKASPEVPVKATLYAFFATWCVPCRVELPHIQRFHDTYASRGLRVVFVSEDAPSSAQNIPAFLARFGVTAPWILDDESELLERYNPTANLPFTVLLDATGGLAYAHAGYEPGDEELLEAKITQVLGPAPVAATTETSATTTAPDASVTAQAPPRFRVTSTFQGLGVNRTSRFDPVDDNDGLLRAGVGRVEVSGYSGNYRASVRVDGALVDDNAMASPDDTGDARVERAQVSAELGPVKLVVGDDYASFGHGVSLSLRKVDPLGLDTSVRGGRADFKSERISVTGLAGFTNPQNFDPISNHIVEESNDLLAGGEVTVSLGQGREIAPYVLYVAADEASGDGGDVSWLTGGASTSLTLGAVRVAAEGAVGAREGLAVDGERETGVASYASAQWMRGPLTWLVDAKYYRRWEIGRADRSLLYHEPPTLEREDQEVPSNSDAVGARTRAEWRVTRQATVFGNLLGYRYQQDGTSPVDGDIALHGYLGGDMRVGDDGSVGVQAGYRREVRGDDTSERKLALWHADVDAAWRLPAQLALTFKWNHREEVKRLVSDVEFRRGLAVIGLSRTGWGTVSALYGYSTEAAATPTHYPGGELLVHLPRGGNVRLFVGRLSGGRICVSGTCRDVPPFQGARLDLIVNL